MRHLVGGIFGKATEGVADPREEEEENEGQAQGMLVEPQDPPAALDRPGCVRVVGKVARIGIDEFGDTRSSRLRRPLLNEARRQQHEYGHLQELALPIFEERLPDVTSGEIGGHGDRCLSMLRLFIVVLGEPGQELAHQKQHEQGHQHQRQRAIANPLHRRHSALPVRGRRCA
jgi:hypothetical protein